MEYVQMTLDDWVEMKRKLRQELQGVKQSFVRIGYALRKIDDQELYKQDGYKSIAEFAKEEYGLEPSTTSRFMSINREYSIDGYSEQLRPEFADLGRSQLEEMLKLPEGDRTMIQPETSREEIRELKRFNKAEPEAGVADDMRQLVEKFYYDNPEILNAVFKEPEFTEETIKHFIEIVNPGGNRSYKKGLYFLMMYENRVAVKRFGTNPQNLTWWEFWKITQDIFGEAAAGPKPGRIILETKKKRNSHLNLILQKKTIICKQKLMRYMRRNKPRRLLIRKRIVNQKKSAGRWKSRIILKSSRKRNPSQCSRKALRRRKKLKGKEKRK